MVRHPIDVFFPKLTTEVYKITSPRTASYNCAAWAAGQVEAWWWPDPMEQAFWPPGVPRHETLGVFIQAFGTIGYAPCETSELEPCFGKIAIYVDTLGKPTHVARQLPDGNWTSKLGKLEDIEHATLVGLSGSRYGSVALFLKRPLQAQRS